MRSVLGDKRAIAILLGPALLVYTAVMLVPIFWSGGYTFFTGNTITGFSYVGLQNYSTFIDDPAAWKALRFTIKYAVVLTITQVAIGYLMALLYIFWLRHGSAFVRTMIFFPVVLPTVAVALLFQKLFELAPTVGPVNSLLKALGMHPIDWFGNPTASFWVVIIMDLWRSIGFYAVLLFTGMLDIPDDVLEAARLDGATGWRIVRYVVVPLSFPVLISALIFSINGTLKVFDSVIALTNGGPAGATTPLTLLMYQTSFTYGDYGYGSTIAFALTLLCLIVTILIFTTSRRDRTRDR